MTQSQNDIVNLSPLLPWSSGEGFGFIEGVAPNKLYLKVTKLPDHSSIELHTAMGDTRTFVMRGELQAERPGASASFVVSPESHAEMRDLVTYIRKSQHIDICREQDVESSDKFTGFSRFEFIPEALPELDFADLDTTQMFMGKTFALPFLITGMTGGTQQGIEINRRLALCAAKVGIPMGVGSQRIALENPEFEAIFKVKEFAANLFVMGNLGGCQLLEGDPVSMSQRAAEMIAADAMAIHINALQESVQAEGDRGFTGILRAIEQIAHSLPIPVMVKEVGSGISPQTARRLRDAGVNHIDVGGRGGTAWGYIEGLRSGSKVTKELAATFRDWGIPTAYAVRAIAKDLPDVSLVATGGIRDGMTIAKALALGATMTGIGLPFLRAALESEEACFEFAESLKRGLETTMILTGSRDLASLRNKLGLGRPFEKEL
jgi:isopentenyl-diphosphate delta-isomerase